MNIEQATRTISLLSELSGGIESPKLVQIFRPGRVVVSLDKEATNQPQAQLLFTFSINLLARLFPVIQEIHITLPVDASLVANVPRWRTETLAEHIHSFLKALESPVRWQVQKEAITESECELVIGSCSKSCDKAIWVGSTGWEAGISSEKPMKVDGAPNPVGAYAAACLGVAEVWKHLTYKHQGLFPHIPIVPLDGTRRFSTYTYLVNSPGANPSIPNSIDLKRLTIIGLGAGGGATAYTLASFNDLRGIVSLVEGDEINHSNLNRYIFADKKDADDGKTKTKVVKGILERFPELCVNVFTQPYGKGSNFLKAEDWEHVVAAVHSREARRDLQYETPKVLWDAGATHDGEFRIWRMILGKTECMHCKHPAGEKDPEREGAKQMAGILGLNQRTLLRKIARNEAFSAEEIFTIKAYVADKEITFDLPREGQRFDDWKAGQCGKIKIEESDNEIPIPFAPVMAGVLIAGEVIKEHYYPEAVLNSRYWNTLLGQFMNRNVPQHRPPKAGCSFCQDTVYLDQYQRRWCKPSGI